MDRATALRHTRCTPGETAERPLASGAGWSAADVLCTSGPQDRPFEERHSAVSLAVVVAGTFQYRAALGREMMTPGSMLLGAEGQCFECGHEHAAGDRCVAFRLAPDVFDRVAAEAGLSAFHYLRTFRELRGVTPHQFVMRARLREAAARLASGAAKVIEVALGSGFDDVSNFNRAFRAEFGMAPGEYRRRGGRR